MRSALNPHIGGAPGPPLVTPQTSKIYRKSIENLSIALHLPQHFPEFLIEHLPPIQNRKFNYSTHPPSRTKPLRTRSCAQDRAQKMQIIARANFSIEYRKNIPELHTYHEFTHKIGNLKFSTGIINFKEKQSPDSLAYNSPPHGPNES